jgi:hypothetical protein
MPRPTLKEEHPDWLKKLIGLNDEQLRGLGLTEEALVDAERGYLRESDYTKKTTEVAAVKKIMDANPGMNWEEAAKTHEWARTQWPTWKKSYDELEVRARTPQPREAPANGNGNGTPRPKWSERISVEDLYETDRLRRAFENVVAGVGEEFIPAARDAVLNTFKDPEGWYQKEELPRMERWAQGNMGVLLNLIGSIWPADKPSMETLLREATLRGSRDLPAVFKEIVSAVGKEHQGGFDEGYKKGAEEAAAKVREELARGGSTPSPSGPIGGSTPAWRRPENPAPKSAPDRFAAVMAKVEAKHGALPR